jgi:hypothetical protein
MTPFYPRVDPEVDAVIHAEEAIAAALASVTLATQQPVRSVRLIDYEDGRYNVEIVLGEKRA